MAEERYTYNKHTWENDELITKENLNNIEDGLARIAEPALGSIRFDSAQRLGEDEKEQARTNLGIAAGTVLTTENLSSGTALVSYGKEQTLEDSEKERARSNIGAIGINDVALHDEPILNLKETFIIDDLATNAGAINASSNKEASSAHTDVYKYTNSLPVRGGCYLSFSRYFSSNTYGLMFRKADKTIINSVHWTANAIISANYKIPVPIDAAYVQVTFDYTTTGVDQMIMIQSTAANDELIEKISDVVVIDDSESNTNDNTKLWIHATPEQEIQIPTMEEFNKLSSRIPTFDLTNESLNRLEEIDLNELANYSSEITTIQEKITSLENRTDTYHINVKNYGAVGDGETDDTQHFQDALDAIAGGTYSELYIPTAHKETYVIKNTLVFPKNLRKIYGDGTAHGSSEFGSILFDANELGTTTTERRGAPLFKYPATSAASPQMLHITNLCFKAAPQPETTTESAHRIGLFLDATNSLVDKDIEFSNCMITSFYTVFDFKGRGLSVINSYITSSNYIATINWDDSSDTNSNHPANMNQRAIYFKNNRLHSITSGFLNITSGHAYGLTFQNNTIDDGRGYLIKATEEAWNWIIQGNLFNGIWSNPETNFMYFNKGCKNCSITNNLLSADPRYWKEEYADKQKFGTTILTNWQWIKINTTATNTNISNNIFEFGYSAAIQANALYGCVISNNNFVNTTFSTAVTPIYLIEALQGSSIIGNTFLYEYITFTGTFKSAPTAAERTLVYNDIIKNGYKNIAAKGCISINTGTPINSTILGNNLTTTIPAEDLEEND